MNPAVISALARSLLAGDMRLDDAYARAARTLGRKWRWLKPLVRRYLQRFAGRTRPRHRDVVQFLRGDPDFQQAIAKYRAEISIAEWIAEPQRMQPAAAARDWQLPAIESVSALADWLCLSIGELEWYADLKGLSSKTSNPKLQHYHYRILEKPFGGIRLLESPKSNLKALQRRILSGILDLIPAHPAVHGFVQGRSIATFAAPHVAKHILLRLDLQDFFPSFPAARVSALFRTLGYPESVAALLTGICTNAAPRTLLPGHACRMLYERPHLPQGAPTSPSLANLMAHRLDCRLNGLAKSAGAAYTRYADDLAFSGGEPFHHRVKRFALHAAAIALEEGLAVNHRKTRMMRQGVRQQLAGVVVNRKPNLRREDLELLEAVLFNCIRSGPMSQNRTGVANFRAHLEGRVGFVRMINPIRGLQFHALLQDIDWTR